MELVKFCDSKLKREKQSKKAISDLSAVEYRLFDRDKFCDVHFILKQKTKKKARDQTILFKGHKAIFCARSEYFRRIFEDIIIDTSLGKTIEFEVDLSADLSIAFRIMMKYIYSDRLEQDGIEDIEEFAIDIFYLAYLYELPRLMSLCEKILIEGIDNDNCVDLFQLAKSYQSSNLYRATEYFIAYHRDDISQSNSTYQLRLTPEEQEHFRTQQQKIIEYYSQQQ